MNTLRALHRWLSIVAALFFMMLATTGIWLQFKPDNLEHVGPSRLNDAIIVADFSRALRHVRALSPQARVGSVFFNVSSDRPSLTIGFMPKAGAASTMPGGDALTIDPATSQLIPAESGLHGTLLQLHNSLLLGSGGRWALVTIGLVLLYLSISGIMFYLDLLRLRIARGQGALFWRSGPARGLGKTAPLWDIHRWLAPFALLFLLIIAVSGLLMQSGPTGLRLWGGSFGPAGVAAVPPPAIIPPDMTDDQLVGVLAKGLALAARQEPHPESLLNLDFIGNGPVTHIGLAYLSPETGEYSRVWDARSWQAEPQTPQFLLFFWLLRLHRGDLFHTTGTILNVATGVALLVITLSGLSMYVGLLVRRGARGKIGLFWK